MSMFTIGDLLRLSILMHLVRRIVSTEMSQEPNQNVEDSGLASSLSRVL